MRLIAARSAARRPHSSRRGATAHARSRARRRHRSRLPPTPTVVCNTWARSRCAYEPRHANRAHTRRTSHRHVIGSQQQQSPPPPPLQPRHWGRSSTPMSGPAVKSRSPAQRRPSAVDAPPARRARTTPPPHHRSHTPPPSTPRRPRLIHIAPPPLRPHANASALARVTGQPPRPESSAAAHTRPRAVHCSGGMQSALRSVLAYTHARWILAGAPIWGDASKCPLAAAPWPKLTAARCRPPF